MNRKGLEPKGYGRLRAPNRRDSCQTCRGAESCHVKLALGQHKQSPFTEEQLQQLRASWAELLPAPDAALKKADGQPFFLNLLSQALRLLEDPDWEILTATPDGFELGVPVRYKDPLPRTPAVFPPKTKHRSLDESPFQEIATNYKSAEEFAGKLEENSRGRKEGHDVLQHHWGA